MKKLKNTINKLFKSKISIIPITVFLLLVCIVGCTSDNNGENPKTSRYSNVPEDQTTSLKISPFIIGDELGMLSRYRTTPENITQLSVFPSARKVYLPKDHPRYTELYNRLLVPEGADSNFVELVIGEWFEEHGQPVIDVKDLSKEEKERLIQEEKESLVPNEQRERNKVALKASNQSISYSQAKDFFDDMNDLNCKNISSNCIPFQYAMDGCYSRAHSMRKHFLERFGFDCEKIFVYGDLVADTQIGCTQEWEWHVAPLVWVKSGNTTQRYVIDPSLFSKPVLGSAWVKSMDRNFDKIDVEPGYIYAPNRSYSKYIEDPNYTHTNKINSDYSKLYGCKNY